MSQPVPLVPVLELSYARTVSEVDEVAERALIKALRIILTVGSFATIAWLSRMCWIFIDDGYAYSFIARFLYVNLVALSLAYLGLRALRQRSPWLNSLLWVAFLLYSAGTVSLHFNRLSDYVTVFFFSVGAQLRLSLFLLMIPLLFGKPTEIWIRRLTLLSIVVLLLGLNRWVEGNWWRWYYAQLSGGRVAYRYMPMSFLEVGLLLWPATLYLFRHRLSRVVNCGAAAWYVACQCLTLELSPRDYGWYEYLSRIYFNQVGVFLKEFVGGLPLAMLVWFSFRFTIGERRALARAPSLADRAVNA